MPVEVIVECGGWDEGVLGDLSERAAEATLAHLGVPARGFEIVVMGCDDARIRALNADFRNLDKPTNVLSWPATDLAAEVPGTRPDAPDPGTETDPEPLGDIALAWETCQREAQEQGKPLDAHVLHLVVHSVLHLLGYDHETDEDAALMEETEVRILGKLGVPDPYAAHDGPGPAPVPSEPMETET
jgi:probable rRNA maturation factor